jgi:hypothetical protein
MSQPNTNWNRWIIASICKHFRTQCTGHIVALPGEDVERYASVNHFDLRIGGPEFREVSANEWWIDVEVNILVQTVVDVADIYKSQRFAGTVAAAMWDGITVYKYGDTSGVDDQSQLGCLTLQGSTDIFDYGQLAPATKMRQQTVSAKYRMTIHS